MNGRETVADFILRRRRALGLNQGELAEAMRVTRTVVSRWENGQQRPNVALIDDLARVLGDDEGHLASLLRYDGDGDQPPLIDPPMRVGDLLRRIGDALIGFLSTDVTGPDDEPGYGWSHDIDRPAQPPSAWATAFGLRAVGLSRGLDRRVSIPQARSTMRRLELPSGGWTARSIGSVARPEITAFVAGVLREAGEDDAYLAERVRLVVDLLDHRAPGAELARPFVLATSLIELSRLELDDGIGRRLVGDLVDLSEEGNGLRGWPVFVRESTFGPRPSSTVHTAMAVAAIASWARRIDDSALASVAQDGLRWLDLNADLDLDDEHVKTPREGGGSDLLPVRHHTAAWVIEGALAVGGSPSSPLMHRAMRDLLRYYVPDAGIWRWPRGGGEYPVWMTYHGVAALAAWSAAQELG